MDGKKREKRDLIANKSLKMYFIVMNQFLPPPHTLFSDNINLNSSEEKDQGGSSRKNTKVIRGQKKKGGRIST